MRAGTLPGGFWRAASPHEPRPGTGDETLYMFTDATRVTSDPDLHLAKVNLISVLFRVLSGRTDIDYPARGGARARRPTSDVPATVACAPHFGDSDCWYDRW